MEKDTEYGKTPDQAIDDNLDLVRAYAQLSVPTALAAAETIGRDVLGSRAGVAKTGALAGELDSLFGRRS